MDTARITERALRLVWHTQSFPPNTLSTADGLHITVLSAGHPNPNSGPDFLNALIRIGNTLFHGDVEIHRNTRFWFLHGHHKNPSYNRVILHVVAAGSASDRPAVTASRRCIPLLVLPVSPMHSSISSCLRPPCYGEKSRMPGAPGRNPCPNVDPDILARLLGDLADQRMELRTRRFHGRLMQIINEQRGVLLEPSRNYCGNPDDIPVSLPDFRTSDYTSRGPWEQLLYETLMESCGFEKNRAAFLRLSRSIPLECLRCHDLHDHRTMMALLFGQGGLLPSIRRVQGKECRSYVLQLKQRWKAVARASHEPRLIESDWLFFRLRPANFPTARLAAFCFLLPRLFGPESFRSLIRTFKFPTTTASARLHRLRALFRIVPDQFWSHHLHFRNSPGGCGVSIGSGRIGDAIINCLLPFAMLYARIFRDRDVQYGAQELFMSHPPLQPNAITRSMERGALRRIVRLSTARLQQGALQLHHEYCSQERCGVCPLSVAADTTERL